MHPFLFLINHLSHRRVSHLLLTAVLLLGQSVWFTPIAKADKLNSDGSAICAVPGKDGVLSGGGQVNTAYTGLSATASAGSSSLDLGPSIGASTPIQPGDLLLVIQMQGADINSTNTSAYGDGDSSNNLGAGQPDYPTDGMANGNLNDANFTAGNFEYVVARNSVGLTGGNLQLTTSLVNNYSNADATSTSGQRRFQVIRVPQYASANITAQITAPAWDGQKGGIVAIDVAGSLTFGPGGSINVDGKGFRGGGARRLRGDGNTPTLSNTDVVTSSSRTANASKAEGTAGTPKYLVNDSFTSLITNALEGYPNGSYGRGAPGNAGGGGTDGRPAANDQNAGGGGGGNGGMGGKGGRTWRSALPYGGDGGAIFTASPRRLALGGGGGAGTTNDNTGSPGGLASSGAAGGGMVMVRSGSIAGSGVINANGASPPSGTTVIPRNDASGGGGAGGSVLLITEDNSAAGLTINANGGRGGTNTGGGSPPAHGPGGGGGGGVIYAPTNAITAVNPGLPGYTSNDTTNFGGATAGTGLLGSVAAIPSDAVTMISGANCLLRVAKSTSTPGPMAAPATVAYTLRVSNPIGVKRTGATGIVITDKSLPAGFTHTPTPISPVYSGGATGPATVTANGTASEPSWQGSVGQPFVIPPGGAIELTFNVNVAAGTPNATYNNSAIAVANYINPDAGVTTVPVGAGAVTANYNGNVITNNAEDVIINDTNTATLSKTVALVEDRDNSGDTTPLTSQVPTPGDILEYTVTAANTSTVNAVNQLVITDPIPANTTYLPGSLTIATGANAGSKTDAAGDDQAEFASNQVIFRVGAGATSAIGGRLGVTATDNASVVKFRVQINDPILPAGTTQVANQATLTLSGFPPIVSNDPSTATPNDPTISRIGPRLRLVKRITGIKKAKTGILSSIGGYNDLATDNNDNANSWPGGATSTLLGAINTAQVPAAAMPDGLAPKDEVEYTIYFVSDGAMNANTINLCDFIPTHQTFVDGSIQLNLNGVTSPIADVPATTNGSGFYTSAFPAACRATNNSKGAVHLQVGDLPISSATPASAAFGFFRFRAKVD